MPKPRKWIPAKGLQIAIDGPSGSGKGTVAARLADAIALPVLDTGLLYRYLGDCARKAGADLDSEASVLAVLDRCLEAMEWRPQGLFVDGAEISERLRGEAVAAAASKVAAMAGVRARLLPAQRRLAMQGCIMDGRDIGTVVLPQAQAKFFLTASLRERARRRWTQLQRAGRKVSLDDVLMDIRTRDEQDTERRHSPMAQARDAICIDTTTMRIDEVVDRILAILLRRGLIREAGPEPGSR